jgi:nucleoside-diphosphate-sugar epimerase
VSSVLITGGSGFIGYHFHRYLDQKRIINLDLEPPSFSCGSVYVKGDVRVRSSIEEALVDNPCDVIVSLAAEHKDFGIAEDEYFRTNEYGTRMACEAAAKHDVKKIVFFSSVAVYGATTEPSTEETQLRPESPYGASKKAAEDVLRQWTENDATRSVVVVRPTVVYGVRNLANMLRLIRQIDTNRYANIGKADNIKSIAYVDNVVQAALFLMERMQPGIDFYNYSDRPQMTTREIAATIADAFGKGPAPTLPYPLVYLMALPFDLAIKLTKRDLPVSTGRIKKLCAPTHHSAAKILQAGFKPQWSNVEGLRHMVDWYLEQKSAGIAATAGEALYGSD